MIDFSQTSIEKIVIHKIGNKSEDEGITLSKSEITNLDESTTGILLTFFLNHFKSEEIYRFNTKKTFSEDSLFAYTNNLFSNEDEFYIQSANIAKRLYDVSTHPNIKIGELYVVYFNSIIIDEQITDAIGIFKSENKDTYLKVYLQGDNFDIEHENGINIKKLDKGCIICNIESEEGYQIKILDNTNKNGEAVYWVEDFIEAKVVENDYFNTNTFMKMCKDFSDTVLTEKNNIDKNEQIGFMSKSFDYLKKNDIFEIEDFKQEVIGNQDVIEHFDGFKTDFEISHDIEPKTQFEVNNDALNKSKKYVKSVIKLDKNFHIYVHSRPEFIEKGFDNGRQMKFYKMYYEEES